MFLCKNATLKYHIQAYLTVCLVSMVFLPGSKKYKLLNRLECDILELHFYTETCVGKVFVDLNLLGFIQL